MLRSFVRKMHVKPIKMRWGTGDNYSYLLTSQDRTHSWIIDPAEAAEVLPELDSFEKKSIAVIANTHHHYDHSDGNLPMLTELKKSGNDHNIKVVGGSKLSPGVTDIPEHLHKYQLGDIEILCIRTPCHTQDSVCYFARDTTTNEQCVFTGDTLFTAGCGRFFEGNGKEMDAALNDRLLQCIGEPYWGTTKVYPGHEYTASNVKFVRKAIYNSPGQNSALDRLERFCKTHAVTTGEFTLHDEVQFNPFMRLDDPAVREAVGDPTGTLSGAEVMTKLRQMKNSM
ncbi:hydroxyacylglutathione hydrolase GLO4 KNAG_0B03060 [Huiozyma naganishii CBS 8797]|uniref:hydroxyacylglutathione hydrolase n=1 Tax=Huiozyma naganishii (strain ATCC MYA-139 / BCRC 22969 / CBS 8797 / KCTC 17520 / NBRC 10181 / NCYC 3082 / Yp74L-3) TaxID=1071383 RepID=J7RGT2_HUIN7|nr:hypothetical protein KNAG_0B03060 [Kazachstania naganishii CBS 8797]CCK68748.1 hypothetical protein KNAG_0B03060 [Kazachstania naganishii CBS 8797]